MHAGNRLRRFQRQRESWPHCARTSAIIPFQVEQHLFKVAIECGEGFRRPAASECVSTAENTSSTFRRSLNTSVMSTTPTAATDSMGSRTPAPKQGTVRTLVLFANHNDLRPEDEQDYSNNTPLVRLNENGIKRLRRR